MRKYFKKEKQEGDPVHFAVRLSDTHVQSWMSQTANFPDKCDSNAEEYPVRGVENYKAVVYAHRSYLEQCGAGS